MNKDAAGMRCAGVVILAWLGSSAAARADVTIQQNTTLDVASMVRMHGTTTESIVADKKRSDTESHCEGLLSMVCGNQHGRGDRASRPGRDLALGARQEALP